VSLEATKTIADSLREHRADSVSGFFWLSAFYFVYCTRPEDWIRVLAIIPIAKVTAIGVILTFALGSKQGRRRLRDLPIEAHYLLALIGTLTLSSVLSPIWRGGALNRTMDFSKVYIAWALTFLLVTNMRRLRRIVYIQAFSLPIICTIAVVKGHSIARLEGVIGGIYSNPNDFAFAIVLSYPFCFMFLLTTRGVRKVFWLVGMLAMAGALVLTASRGGFITLLITGVVGLWHFGIRGKRYSLIAATALVAAIVLAVAGGPLMTRFTAIWSDNPGTKQEATARNSYEDRKYLMERALEGFAHYPILGMGTRNFEVYSLDWHEVHMTYLEIAVEGGIFGLTFYMLFFRRGFRNLHVLLKRKDLSKDVQMMTWALHCSLVGFVVGALFAPEAYVYFPFFSVGYTSALYAIVREQDRARLAAGETPGQPVRKLTSWTLPVGTAPETAPLSPSAK